VKNGAQPMSKKTVKPPTQVNEQANQANDLPNLETSLDEITQLIDKMEHGEQTLEQSLNHFERGIHLIKHCQKILAQAEQKVQILMQNNGQEELTVYRENESDRDKEKQGSDSDEI
jgi:exodeoxyribonuclease VII small subunit